MENNHVYHYHLDHLGTPQEITDAQGNLVWAVSYKAYGNLAVAFKNEVENNIRFQGQYYDQEAGLHYNRFRYYDPECGRFVNQDPIGLAGGMNGYLYSEDPLHWVDPFGLSKYIVIDEGQAAVEEYTTAVSVDYPGNEYRTIKSDWNSILKSSGASKERFGSSEWEMKAIEGNADWIEKMHNEGYEFIDIGEDSAANRSPFYQAEKKRISDVGAKVYKAPSKRVRQARGSAPVSNRPASKVYKKCKESGII